MSWFHSIFSILWYSESNFSFSDRPRDVLEADVVADHHLVAAGAVINPIWTGRSITRQNSNYALESTVLMMKQLLSLKWGFLLIKFQTCPDLHGYIHLLSTRASIAVLIQLDMPLLSKIFQPAAGNYCCSWYHNYFFMIISAWLHLWSGPVTHLTLPTWC